MNNFFIKNKNKILFFLITISILSFIETIRKGLLNGCDFQWQPALLFWEGINHYERFMSNGKSEFLCQGGEYSHLLHIIYYPYVLFKWETARALWLLTNIFFVISVPLLICNKFKISKYKTIILILIFITCYPSRMTLNYGQQSLFVLFFMTLPFIFKSNFFYFLSGISSVKYSTGYVIFLNFLVKKEFKNFFLATIPYLLGWFIYFMYTNSDPIINFFEPLKLSFMSHYMRDADIYSLLQIYYLGDKGSFLKYISIACIFLLNSFILIRINRQSSNFLKMSLVLICPLVFFPHSNYDYVLLFPLACYSLLNFHGYLNKINFFFVIYIFYLSRIVKHLLDIDWLYQPTLMLLIILLIIMNTRTDRKVS